MRVESAPIEAVEGGGKRPEEVERRAGLATANKLESGDGPEAAKIGERVEADLGQPATTDGAEVGDRRGGRFGSQATAGHDAGE